MEARIVLVAVALFATSILLEASLVAAATAAHVVGGSTGWTIPPNTSLYSDWSSSQTIKAGDTLVFNFPTGIHTVMEVPKSNFDSCSTTKQIGSTLNNGPATVTVTSGTHYYICSIPGHCSAGQKLAITVAAAAVAPSVSAAAPTVNKAAPAPAPVPKASAPTPARPASATAPAKGAVQKAYSPAPAAAPKVVGPTASSPVTAAAPTSHSPAPAAVPKVAVPTASSPAPTADKKSAAPPTGSVPTVPSSSANPPAAPGPSGSGNGSNSSPALRGVAGMVVALLAVATVSFLF